MQTAYNSALKLTGFEASRWCLAALFAARKAAVDSSIVARRSCSTGSPHTCVIAYRVRLSPNWERIIGASMHGLPQLYEGIVTHGIIATVQV